MFNRTTQRWLALLVTSVALLFGACQSSSTTLQCLEQGSCSDLATDVINPIDSPVDKPDPVIDTAQQDIPEEIDSPAEDLLDTQSEEDRLVDQREVEDVVPDLGPLPCPEGMLFVIDVCIDRWEAPNKSGANPLVMYTFYQAEAWCNERGKRLCYDDEWTRVCEGTKKYSYPYGNGYLSGTCNDSQLPMAIDLQKLKAWPESVATPQIETLEQLLTEAGKVSVEANLAVAHIKELYLATPSGTNAQCRELVGVEDLTGNVEEWTRRRDGGRTVFWGNLKGSFWGEAQNCQSGDKLQENSHRDYFIGFRCCKDPKL